jgi:hypothetical protein
MSVRQVDYYLGITGWEPAGGRQVNKKYLGFCSTSNWGTVVCVCLSCHPKIQEMLKSQFQAIISK